MPKVISNSLCGALTQLLPRTTHEFAKSLPVLALPATILLSEPLSVSSAVGVSDSTYARVACLLPNAFPIAAIVFSTSCSCSLSVVITIICALFGIELGPMGFVVGAFSL